MAGDESDDQEGSLRLRNMLADINISNSSALASPARLSARPSLMLPRRVSSREQSRSLHEVDSHPTATSSPTPPLFSNPNRSIFSSGPPTSSISANTAQASMSSPQSPSSLQHPLSALTSPSLHTRRIHRHSSIPTPSRRARFSGVEKDADDPSGSMEESLARRAELTTSSAVSSLFAAPDSTVSRQASYVHQTTGPSCIRGNTPFHIHCTYFNRT